MKKTILSLFVLTIFTACSTDELITPTPNLKLVPEHFEQLDFSKTFEYDPTGQLTGVTMVSRLPNGATMESRQSYFYDVENRLNQTTTDNGWVLVYTLSDGQIARTDEYVNCWFTQYHTYEYNANGLLIKSFTWQNIPEEGGEIRVAKDEYEYNSDGNLTTHRLYYYSSFGKDPRILTTFTFSDYDTKLNAEDHFSAIAANPLVVFRKNNPGKMVVRNRFGNISSVETYTYEYHTKGYPTNKVTNVTFQDGSTSSYETTYRFQN
jgi:hypothetical protein